MTSKVLCMVILSIWLSDSWRDLWNDLGLSRQEHSPASDLPRDSTDALIWRTCQQEELVLVTGNRNDDDADSLEAVIRAENQPNSLPVITLANPQRIAGIASTPRPQPTSLLELSDRIDDFRGAGRIYVP